LVIGSFDIACIPQQGYVFNTMSGTTVCMLVWCT